MVFGNIKVILNKYENIHVMWLFRLHVWVVPRRELIFAHFHPDKHDKFH